MFAFRERRGPVEVAFTDRHDPAGGPLNLSLVRDGCAVTGPDPGDSMRHVVDGLALAEPAVGLTQVHGGDVFVLDESWSGDPVEADGIVTRLPGRPLLVRAADCVPVLLADPEAGVVGAAHAGRPGLIAGVVPHTVAALRGLGAVRLHAWVGPHVCGACYEVPDRMRADVAGPCPRPGR